ncbi:MAG TPA: acyltransferase [Opitutaceae bacterium]
MAHDPRLDGLRGFAAVSVMMVHASWITSARSAVPLPQLNEYVANFHMSRPAVLLFFITSGYVIGLTNRQPFSPELAREYLRRRCLRIVPIYLLAIMAGWWAYQSVPRLVVLENALFLQNPAWHITPLPGNLPVWSLHNEVVYYLGFILLWAFRPRIVHLACVLFALATFDWFVGGPLSFLGGWAVGALFWLGGLLLSWNRVPRATHGTVSILCLVLFAFATNHFWPGVVLLKGLGFPYAGGSTLWLADLALLPVTLSLFCAVVSLDFPGRRAIAWAAALIPIGMCLALGHMGRLWQSATWTMAGIATILAVLLMPLKLEQLGARFFALFRPLGKISYGLYLFHVPCLALVGAFFPWTGGGLNYATAFLSWFAVSVLVAWVCEARLQPALLSYYKTHRAKGASV